MLFVSSFFQLVLSLATLASSCCQLVRMMGHGFPSLCVLCFDACAFECVFGSVLGRMFEGSLAAPQSPHKNRPGILCSYAQPTISVVFWTAELVIFDPSCRWRLSASTDSWDRTSAAGGWGLLIWAGHSMEPMSACSDFDASGKPPSEFYPHPLNFLVISSHGCLP